MHEACLISTSYRLGPFGFLTSDELRWAGYKANNGLRDQRVAMQWVQRHIRDFGGDPEKVTLAGMSAGGGMWPVVCWAGVNESSIGYVPSSL